MKKMTPNEIRSELLRLMDTFVENTHPAMVKLDHKWTCWTSEEGDYEIPSIARVEATCMSIIDMLLSNTGGGSERMYKSAGTGGIEAYWVHWSDTSTEVGWRYVASRATHTS